MEVCRYKSWQLAISAVNVSSLECSKTSYDIVLDIKRFGYSILDDGKISKQGITIVQMIKSRPMIFEF